MKTRHRYVVPCELHTHDCQVTNIANLLVKSCTKVQRILTIIQALADVSIDNHKYKLFVYRKTSQNDYYVYRCILIDSINDLTTMRNLSLVGNDNVFKLVLKQSPI